MFSTALIAVVRLVGVVFPMHAEDILTLRRSWVAVAAVWVEAFALLLFPVMGVWGTVGYVPATFSCTVLPHPSTGIAI